jgi:hypothetical protein
MTLLLLVVGHELIMETYLFFFKEDFAESDRKTAVVRSCEKKKENWGQSDPTPVSG